ncbi:MAG: hypothetical protein HRU28_16620 [Rhizobiales bacterium]|nr:hypothetical protein [Hyphomicrobiales bacterium]
MNKFLRILALSVVLIMPTQAFASGGDTPVPGIDIIIKGLTENKSSFTKSEMLAVNRLKGLEKPAMIARIAARKAKKMPLVTPPKGGWYAVFKSGLIKEWCFECDGGSTIIKGTSLETGKKFVVTIKLKSNGGKPAIVKMKAKAAVMGIIKK